MIKYFSISSVCLGVLSIILWEFSIFPILAILSGVVGLIYDDEKWKPGIGLALGIVFLAVRISHGNVDTGISNILSNLNSDPQKKFITPDKKISTSDNLESTTTIQKETHIESIEIKKEEKKSSWENYWKICKTLPTVGRNNTLPSSATLDSSSLLSESKFPIISGTYTNSGAILLYIWKGKITPPTDLKDNIKSKVVWSDFPDHGGDMAQCPGGSATGIFFNEVKKPLDTGEYTIGIYTYDTIYTSTGYKGDTKSKLLTGGYLNVNY